MQGQHEFDRFLRKLLSQTVDASPDRLDFNLGPGLTIKYPDFLLAQGLPAAGTLYDQLFDPVHSKWMPWLDTGSVEPIPPNIAFNVRFKCLALSALDACGVGQVHGNTYTR